jgi:putative endonuclease
MTKLRRKKGRIGWVRTKLARSGRARLGEWGEWVASKYLLDLGWDLLARNWRTRRGELDLIAFDESHLVFVEVKTRRLPSLLPPEENIDEAKKDRIESLAYGFMNRFELNDGPIRFDLITVETKDLRDYEIRHYLGFM